MNTIELDDIFYIKLLVTDTNGDGILGLTVTYAIYKSSDNSLIDSGTLTDAGDGLYTESYTCDTLGQFYIVYTTPIDYTNEIESINVISELATADALARVLGLSDEYKKISNTTYDSNNNLTDATVTIYPTLTDYENETNVTAVYTYTATYSSSLMQTMGIKRIS